MPSGEALGPGTRPVHYVFGSGFFPESEVIAVLLLVLSVQFARFSDYVLKVPATEFPVMIILGVLLHVHIHAAVADVGVAFVKNLLHKSNLLYDVSAGVGLY